MILQIGAIEFADLVKAVTIAVTLQLGIAVVGFLVFRTQATEWHKSNLDRFGRIEKALGIEDPDEVAFPRKSDFERIIREKEEDHTKIWNELHNHGDRIRDLESKTRR